MAANLPEVTDNVVSFREARARRIRELAAEWAQNTIRLGQELLAVRETFPEDGAGWHEWIEANTDISRRQVSSLIRIARKFGGGGAATLVASGRVLDFLARDTTPEAGRNEVIERIASGETIGRKRAEEIIREHRPKPSEARKIARETGKPTQASDGNIYLGATKEQEQEAEARRKTVYDVRRAVETFSTMQVSAEDFLALALPHQLWNKAEEYQLHTAYEWLTDLIAAWEARR